MMKTPREYQHPSKIVFGRGAIHNLPRLAMPFGRRVLLVTGAESLKKNNTLNSIIASLRKEDITPIIYDQVCREADIEFVKEGVDLCRREKADVVVGIGGGSAMDTAKVIAGLTLEEDNPEIFHGKKNPSGNALPFIAVPTTAGSGAEATNNGVISDYQRKIKESIRHPAWLARVIIADPELTLSLPPEPTAFCGADALTQAVEAYVSLGASFISDAQALAGLRLIIPAYLQAVSHGQDLQARSDMLYGSLLAGLALSHARLGAVHGIAHPVGIRFEAPHGLVCGVLLPYVMRKNLEVSRNKYADIFRILKPEAEGLPVDNAASQAIDLIEELLQKAGLPRNLAAYDSHEVDFDSIIQPARQSGSTKHNPYPFTANDVEDILYILFPERIRV